VSTKPSDLEFPIWVRGIVDGAPIHAPFISGMEANFFIEGLRWASKNLACTVSLVVYEHGEEAQKIEFQPGKH